MQLEKFKSEAIEVNGTSFMEDATGSLRPVSSIKEIKLLRNELAVDYINEALQLSAMLSDFKQRMAADIQDLVEISYEKYGVKMGGKKGNVNCTAFNGKGRVQRIYSDVIEFTEELQAAKELIIECVNDWMDGSNDNAKAFVDRIFKTNRKGEVRTTEVMRLFELKVDDPRWPKALDALRDSISVTGKAVYYAISFRQEDGNYKRLPLDLAGV